MSEPRAPRLTFFVDVDNTLLDNDRVKKEMDRRLAGLLGEAEAARFWDLYEQARAELGAVDIPTTLSRFLANEPEHALRFDITNLFMRFPFEEFLFSSSLTVIKRLRSFGTVVILSDGDPIFQLAKITRSGLAAAVDGYVVVYPHKEEHLPELTSAFVADHFVLIDDKPGVIERVSANIAHPLTSVFVRQGRYAASVPPGPWPGASRTVDSIEELTRFDASWLNP
jgi:hypothetical protein